MKNKKEYYDQFITKVPDFPKKGVLFYDITSVLLKPEVYTSLINDAHSFYSVKKIDCIAVVESRGYLIGAPLSLKMQLPLVLIRKEGKLPRAVFSEEYELEYGFGRIEVHKDDIKMYSNILLIDDILATGGTLKSSAILLERAGGKIKDIFCFIELCGINGRQLLEGYEVNSLVRYN
ncbi:adenine phosphoribosyltransferase [Borrelia sp. CA_690]|uniref:Adenine phosphoribosyltransferase n=1 Tax=Borrelia maritima TaxID=2761123 RepID=A0A5J6WC17_9SPIR|nr:MULTISPECIES: adenine phosphoribosyltransferase [Borrelia]QFI14866.1 adenine phosphoribosyltransferase [Borrelia maritima]WKC84722.1 adenine phosphoribosyltransferase [Borrelia sp. CA_690]